jgi:phosphonate C-P lyase system protein PhnG
MDKKTMFKILSLAKETELSPIADRLTAKYKVQLIKEPHKTLVMLKVRESVKNSLFYLGEALATECMVAFQNTKGYALVLGDNFLKATSIAVIDGALNAGVSEREEIMDLLLRLYREQAKRNQMQNAKILTSKVSFDVMEV